MALRGTTSATKTSSEEKTGKGKPAKGALAKASLKKTEGKKVKIVKAKTGEGGVITRTSSYSGMYLFPKVKENPRKEGTRAGDSVAFVLNKPGISFEDYRAAGAKKGYTGGMMLVDLRYNIDKGFIEARKSAGSGKAARFPAHSVKRSK